MYTLTNSSGVTLRVCGDRVYVANQSYAIPPRFETSTVCFIDDWFYAKSSRAIFAQNIVTGETRKITMCCIARVRNWMIDEDTVARCHFIQTGPVHTLVTDRIRISTGETWMRTVV